jgi:hypothetical protein
MHMVESPVLAFITGSLHIRVLRSVQASMKVGLVSTTRRILQYKHTHTHTHIHKWIRPVKTQLFKPTGQCSVQFPPHKTIFNRDGMLTLILLLTFTWPEATALRFALQSALCRLHIECLTLQQCLYRPAQTLLVTGSGDSQISRQSAHGGGKGVSPTHL